MAEQEKIVDEQLEKECQEAYDKIEKIRVLMTEIDELVESMTKTEFTVYYLMVESKHETVCNKKVQEMKKEVEEMQNEKH